MKHINQREFYENQILRLEKDIAENKRKIEKEKESQYKDNEIIRVLNRDNNRFLSRLNFYKSKIK